MNQSLINADLCKGCRVCVESCPKHCLSIGSAINILGYQYAVSSSEGCTACGICFYVCPEPGAVTVHKGLEASV